jgi:hypothetical protein
LQSWIGNNPEWSRKRLARELCAQWDWRNGQGRLKDFAARSLLLKLEGGGWIRLPPLQEHQRRIRKKPPKLKNLEEPPPREGSLQEFKPFSLEVITPTSPKAALWAALLDRYHYLGLRVVGENLGYLALDGIGREVGCLLFGAPAWRCRVRDDFLQWPARCAERPAWLSRIANNTRFLLLPWVRIPHLASHLLALVAARISQDWKIKYGHDLDWLETFVDTGRYRGACYRAANWQYIGQTTGRTRQDRDHRLQVSRKAVYLYRLLR